MTDLFKKLNFKNHKEIMVLNAPPEFQEALAEMQKFCSIITSLKGKADFVLAFVKNEKQIETLAPKIVAHLIDDAVFWFAYPKKSSKKYRVEINRDQGWNSLGSLGFEPVRAVAVDDDWSALRFRHVDFIKNLKRNPKMVRSEEGKKHKDQR